MILLDDGVVRMICRFPIKDDVTKAVAAMIRWDSVRLLELVDQTLVGTDVHWNL